MVDKPILRYFVLCADFASDPDGVSFSLRGVFEGFYATTFPTREKFSLVIDIYNLQSGMEHSFLVQHYNNGVYKGDWNFANRWIEDSRSNMILTINAEDFEIEEPGGIEFRIIVDGEVISTQFVYSLKEEEVDALGYSKR